MRGLQAGRSPDGLQPFLDVGLEDRPVMIHIIAHQKIEVQEGRVER